MAKITGIGFPMLHCNWNNHVFLLNHNKCHKFKKQNKKNDVTL